MNWLPKNPHDDDIRTQCGNCGTTWRMDQLNSIPSAEERLFAGETIPAGECPDEKCLACCYIVTPKLSLEIVFRKVERVSQNNTRKVMSERLLQFDTQAELKAFSAGVRMRADWDQHSIIYTDEEITITITDEES